MDCYNSSAHFANFQVRSSLNCSQKDQWFAPKKTVVCSRSPAVNRLLLCSLGGEGEGGEDEGGEGDEDEVGEGGGDVHPVVIFRVFGTSAPRSFSGLLLGSPEVKK